MYGNAPADGKLVLNEKSFKEKLFNILCVSIPILMGVSLFSNPFPHTTAIKEFSFYISVLIIIFLIFSKRIDFSFKSPLTTPYILFALWAFIGLFFALNKENSMHDYWAHLLKYLAIYYILINFFDSKKRFEHLSWIIIISATIFSIGGMFYFYVILGNSISGRMGFAGIAAINNVGFVTVPAMILSLNQVIKEKELRKKIVLLICLSGTLLASLLTQTLGTLLSIIFSLLVMFIQNKKYLIVLCLCLIIAIGLLPIKHRLSVNDLTARFFSQNIERLKIWHTYFGVISNHPIIGVGYGMRSYMDEKVVDMYEQYRASSPIKYRPARFHTPHNMYIDTAMRLGYVGFALFIYILSVVIYMSIKMIIYGRDTFIKKWALCLMAVVITYLIQGFFVDILFGPYLISLYTIFAFMTILWRFDTDPYKAQSNMGN